MLDYFYGVARDFFDDCAILVDRCHVSHDSIVIPIEDIADYVAFVEVLRLPVYLPFVDSNWKRPQVWKDYLP